jgi:hypothetical protein
MSAMLTVNESGVRDNVKRGRTDSRLTLGPVEIAVCFCIAIECLLINALVVAHAPTLSLDSLGPVAVAYHGKEPRPLGVAVVILVLLLGSFLPRGARVASLVFVGAAVANFASPSIWSRGIPDYLVFGWPDVILNVPDVLMIVTGVVIAVSIGSELVRRGRTVHFAPRQR